MVWWARLARTVDSDQRHYNSHLSNWHMSSWPVFIGTLLALAAVLLLALVLTHTCFHRLRVRAYYALTHPRRHRTRNTRVPPVGALPQCPVLPPPLARCATWTGANQLARKPRVPVHRSVWSRLTLNSAIAWRRMRRTAVGGGGRDVPARSGLVP
jgi:hypothetical protein